MAMKQQQQSSVETTTQTPRHMNSTFVIMTSTEVPSTIPTTNVTNNIMSGPLQLLPKHHQKYSDPNNNYYFYRHQGNSTTTTLSTSVTIHVTPEHYHLISWICLWIFFVVAISFGAYQSYKENQWLTDAQKVSTTGEGGPPVDDLEQQQQQQLSTSIAAAVSTKNDLSKVSIGGNTRRGKPIFVGGARVSTGGTTMSVVGRSGGNGSDREAVSSGDMSRTMVCLCRCYAVCVCVCVCVCFQWDCYGTCCMYVS
jgi:hypothetical protein